MKHNTKSRCLSKIYSFQEKQQNHPKPHEIRKKFKKKCQVNLNTQYTTPTYFSFNEKKYVSLITPKLMTFLFAFLPNTKFNFVDTTQIVFVFVDRLI